jgi:hypothetical protein
VSQNPSEADVTPAQGGEAGSPWQERALRAEAELEESLAERNRLWEEVHRRNARERELEQLLAETRGSRTWRWTAAIRELNRIATRLRPALVARLKRRLRR